MPPFLPGRESGTLQRPLASESGGTLVDGVGQPLCWALSGTERRISPRKEVSGFVVRPGQTRARVALPALPTLRPRRALVPI